MERRSGVGECIINSPEAAHWSARSVRVLGREANHLLSEGKLPDRTGTATVPGALEKWADSVTADESVAKFGGNTLQTRGHTPSRRRNRLCNFPPPSLVEKYTPRGNFSGPQKACSRGITTRCWVLRKTIAAILTCRVGVAGLCESSWAHLEAPRQAPTLVTDEQSWWSPNKELRVLQEDEEGLWVSGRLREARGDGRGSALRG